MESVGGRFSVVLLLAMYVRLWHDDFADLMSCRCIIVDSTRRGKSMPDALSKTVGIWIAVLNRLLFPDVVESHKLLTPQEVVSESEHAQIEERLEGCVREVQGLELDVGSLRAKLKKPMRPVWVTPATDISALPMSESGDGFATVVLCTASSRSSGEVRDDPGYVQGAADDSEAWACGLDAVTFWSHSEELLACREDDLPDLIANLVASTNSNSQARPATKITPPGFIWIGENASVEQLAPSFDVVVHCGPRLSGEAHQLIERDGRVLYQFPCASGKNGSRQLRACLPGLEKLCDVEIANPKILITSHDGKDLAVGVALCLICMFCSEDRAMNHRVRQQAPNKAEIKKRLSWILVSMPEASPSRATLQSANSYLMG